MTPAVPPSPPEDRPTVAGLRVLLCRGAASQPQDEAGLCIDALRAAGVEFVDEDDPAACDAALLLPGADRSDARALLESAGALPESLPRILLISRNLEDIAIAAMSGSLQNLLVRDGLTPAALLSALLHAAASAGEGETVSNQDTPSDGVVDWDLASATFAVDTPFAAFLGLTVGKRYPAPAFVNALAPEAKPAFVTLVRDAAMSAPDDGFTAAVRLLDHEGRTADYRMSLTLTDGFDDGTPARYLLRFLADPSSDPTRIPPSLSIAMLDALGDAVVLMSQEGRLLHCNARAARMYGWTAEKLVDTPLVESTFGASFRKDVFERLLAGEDWEGEVTRQLHDGSAIPVHARWLRLRHEGRIAFIGIERDISERRQLEAELQQSRKLARIGILSEGIAHELRNPLSYALSAAQLLDQEELPPDVRHKCLQTIQTGLQKSGLIVDNLLSLGRPHAHFSRKHTDLAAIITEALAAASTHASFRKVRVSRHLPAQPLHIHGNHDMLVQVFHNVLTNALNEMASGGTLTITAEESGGRIVARISDTGPGVSEEQISHLFDPFYTASSSGKGTGLGLTLSYYIMKEHDGAISVESTPGKGATFVLTLPAAGAARQR